MEGYITDKYYVLRHIVDARLDTETRLHNLVDLMKNAYGNYITEEFTDYTYHQIFSDIILNVNKELEAKGESKLEKPEEIRLVMESKQDYKLLIIDMLPQRLEKVSHVCNMLIAKSMDTIKACMIGTVVVSDSTATGDLIELYDSYLSEPNKQTESMIRKILENKKKRFAETLDRGYLDNYLLAVNSILAAFKDTWFFQPNLNSTSASKYNFDNAKAFSSNGYSKVIKSLESSDTLHGIEYGSNDMFPITFNTMVNTHLGEWVSYDRLSLRSGTKISGVKQITHEQTMADINLNASILDVSIPTYLSKRSGDTCTLITLGNTRVWAESLFSLIKARCDKTFFHTSFFPWIDSNMVLSIKTIMDLQKKLDASVVKDIKDLAADLLSSKINKLDMFIDLSCDVKSVLEASTREGITDKYFYVKEKYLPLRHMILTMGAGTYVTTLSVADQVDILSKSRNTYFANNICQPVYKRLVDILLETIASS